MPLQTRRIEVALRQKGFVPEKGDHRFYRYKPIVPDDKLLVRTKVSHGTSGAKKDVDDFLLMFMARQCKLTRHEFEDLIHCPMSQEQFEAILRERRG